MLNPQEETFLKHFVREHMPMARPTVQHVEQPAASIEPIIDREVARGKMVTVNMQEDYGIISTLSRAGVLRKIGKRDEPLAAFYARTGLGRAQIISWTKEPEKIRAFVEQAEKNNAADGVHEPKSFSESRERPVAPAPRAFLV